MTPGRPAGPAGATPAVAPAWPGAAAPPATLPGLHGARHGGPGLAFRTVLERAAESSRAESQPAAPPTVLPAHSPALGPGESCADASRPRDASDDREDARPRSRSLADDGPVGSGWAAPAPPPELAPLFRPEFGSATAAARAVPSLEHLMTALVRRIAWSGDGRRGAARLEIGAGALAGATLVIHADAGRVRVHLDVPSGVDADAWRERIVRGLAARHIPADGVDVA